jgi:peptide/nickel transport system substrate-binding protein
MGLSADGGKSLSKLEASLLLVILASAAFLAILPVSVQAATSTPTTVSLGEIYTPPVSALNPFNPSSDYNLVGILYDYMFSFNWPPLPTITDVMAGGYSSNAAGTQWTVSLRPNLEWSNGTPLNSTDLEFTLNLYNESGDYSPAITQLTILNSTSVQIDLASANTNFILTGFIYNGFAVLPSQTFGKVAFADLGSFQNLNNVVADGPYVLSNYTGQNPIAMQANPHYWGGPPHLRTLDWYQYTSQSSEFDAYVAGQLDALAYPGAYSGLESIANLTGHTLIGPPYATPGLTVGAYLNDWVYPTNDSAFRLALAYGTNVSLVNDELSGPFASQSAVAQDFLLPAYNQQIFGNTTGPSGYSYNVATAKQILESNGFKYSGSTLEYPNGTAVSLTIKYRTYEPYSQSVATLLDSSWSQLGITVTPVSVPSATLRSGANNASGWQVIATGVLGPQTNFGVTPGPGIVADLGDYYVFEGGVHTSWNSTYYGVIQRLASDPVNSSQFNADARDAATTLATDVPVIPLFNVNNWGSVSNDYYWGSASNSTGIYYPQAITQLTYWDIALDTIAPLSTGATSTTSTVASTGSSTTSTSSTSSSTSLTSNAMLYIAAAAVVIVLIAAGPVVDSRRRGNGSTVITPGPTPTTSHQ